MTRKHYVAIARILNDARENSSDPNNWTAREIAFRLADYFASENPHFDNARFLAACGVSTHEEVSK